MKLTKKLLTSIIGISAVVGTTFIITSCSKHENPWSSIKVGDNFTIHGGDANDMIAIAKTHIQQATSKTDAQDIFKNLPDTIGKDEVYWSIAYATAWYVNNDPAHANRAFVFTSIGDESSSYVVNCSIAGSPCNGNPTAENDTTNNIYQMAIGGTQIGLAYILANFKPA